MKLTHPELQDRLAAEYVLGSMRGGARRRFEEYAMRDAALRAAVVRWEDHLTPLAERISAVEPPARVWEKIATAVDGGQSRHPPVRIASVWQSLAFWRNIGLATSGLAAALLVAVLAIKPVEQEPMLMAVLAEDNNEARVYVEQPKSNLLMVKMIKPWKTSAERSHELWVIPTSGTPRSLGVINSSSDTQISLSGLDAKLVDGAVFAVSIEPPGGSATGAPTGKVVCKGGIAWMPPKPGKVRPQI
jgi:anti-sigma-K factor RskA